MNIYILNAVSSGFSIISDLRRLIAIKGVIGLSASRDRRDVSGFECVETRCRGWGLDFIAVDDYSLSAESDRAKLKRLEIDALFVTGWQRLIPGWLIKRCRLGAYGGHGSPWGIHGGRGRSPQNWALILGEKFFELSLFKLTENIDDGEVVASGRFSYSDADDIKTSYMKAGLLMSKMIADFVRRGFSGTCAQKHAEARYLPQRKPEDGAIDWKRSASQVLDFIRALTRPYPGAFCGCGSGRLSIWKARRLDIEWPGKASPGEILKIFPDGELLVAAGDGFLLIDDYEAANASVAAGGILSSVCFTSQMRGIAARHQKRHPDLPLQESILKAADLPC